MSQWYYDEEGLHSESILRGERHKRRITLHKLCTYDGYILKIKIYSWKDDEVTYNMGTNDDTDDMP